MTLHESAEKLKRKKLKAKTNGDTGTKLSPTNSTNRIAPR
jgi:hypothetical protein